MWRGPAWSLRQETPKAPMSDSIRIPRALEHQKKILYDVNRYKVAACGRRWGKTAMGLISVLAGHGSLEQPRIGAAAGGHIWWTAPTYGVAAKIWRDLKKAAKEAWKHKYEAERTIVFKSGGIITVKSADRPDMLRGEGLDGVVLDEAAFCRETLWHDVLRPSLTDRGGWAILISTPNGRNWFYRLWRDANETLGWHRWQLPTAENPMLPPEEIEQARLDIGARSFSQEYCAQFLDVAGSEFSGSAFGDQIWSDPPPDDAHLKILSIDPSKGRNEKSDYTAILQISFVGDLAIIDGDVERIHLTELVGRILQRVREFRPHAVVIEINQFQETLAKWLADTAEDIGLQLPLYTVDNVLPKLPRIRTTITPWLSRERLKFVRHSKGAEQLVEQLQAFPTHQYDDGPDALEMGLRIYDVLMQGEDYFDDDPIAEYVW